MFYKIKRVLKSYFSKGAAHIFIGSFLSKFAAFFGSIFIVRALSKADYGTLGYIENLFNYVYVFAGMGLTYALFRYVVLAETNSIKKAYHTYVVKFSFQFNTILAIVLSVIMIIYPHPVEFKSAAWLLPILLVSLPFHSFVDSQNSTFRSMFDNKKYAFSLCLLSLVIIGSKYLFARLWGIEGAIFSPVLIYIFASGILMYVVNHMYFQNVSFIPLNVRQKREVNRYSIQYMLTNSIWTIFMLNDVFLLALLTGNAAIVAEYKVAYVLPANLSLISASIGVFVAPYFVKNETNYEWIQRSYKKVLIVTAGIVGVSTTVLFIFSEPIISLLYGENYLSVVPVMQLLLIASFINNGLRYTNANLLAAMGEIKYNLFIAILGVALQVIINILIIPRLGMRGVAYTSIVVYLMMAICLYSIFRKKYFNKNIKKDK